MVSLKLVNKQIQVEQLTDFDNRHADAGASDPCDFLPVWTSSPF